MNDLKLSFRQVLKKAPYERLGLVWIGSIAHDLKHSIRTLHKHPLSNGIIVLTIALVISSVSVLYNSIEDDMAQSVPFPERERVVQFWRIGERKKALMFPANLFLEYQERLESYEALGVIKRSGRMTLTEVGEPKELSSVAVTLDLLPITGLTPIRGRIFQKEDETAGDDNTILISEQVWREKLDEDPNIIGRDLLLDDKPYSVIGVLPAAIRTTKLGFDVDVWRMMRADRSDRAFKLLLVARLKSGVSVGQAQAELDILAPRLEQRHNPGNREKEWYPQGFKTGRVLPLTQPFFTVQNEIPAEIVFAWVFGGTVFACVVGIACFNITSLLLARHSARSREIAIRLSLGARRFRIVQQLLTETVLLALLGGIFGLLGSFWISYILRFQHINPELDWRLYFIALGGSLVLGILVGLVPALRSSRKDLTESIKDGGLSIGGRRRHLFRNFLVTSELAMASVLCLAGGLMTRNLMEFYSGELGFEPDRLITVKVQPRSDWNLSENDQIAYIERGLQALHEIPGIESVSLCLGHYMTRFIPKENFGLPSLSGDFDGKIQVPLLRVRPGFTQMFGMPVVRGQRLSGTENRGTGEVLINETFAARYFPGTEPIGQQIRSENEGERLTIVGVVRDRHQRMCFSAVEPEVFRDFRDNFAPSGFLFVAQTRDDSRGMAERIRGAIARIDTGQPVNQPEAISVMLDRRASNVKGPMVNLVLLAGVGLLIALAGVYGVVSFSVVERTREVGVRMALGGTQVKMLRLMLWQGARLMLIGIPLGILFGALVVSNDLAGAIFGSVSPVDVPTYAGVVLLVGLIGMCASLIPARRVTKINPMEALRSE